MANGAACGFQAVVAHRFSSIAAAAVAALVVTAAIQAYALGGGVTGLTGTAYGVTLMVKTLLFTAMLAFAAQNRLALVPSLTQDGSRVRSRLLRNIAAETVLCLLVVLAAALLSSFEPGLHAAGH